MAAFVPTLFLRKLFKHADGREILVREDTLDERWLVDLRAPGRVRRVILNDERGAADFVLGVVGREDGWRDESPHQPVD